MLIYLMLSQTCVWPLPQTAPHSPELSASVLQLPCPKTEDGGVREISNLRSLSRLDHQQIKDTSPWYGRWLMWLTELCRLPAAERQHPRLSGVCLASQHRGLQEGPSVGCCLGLHLYLLLQDPQQSSPKHNIWWNGSDKMSAISPQSDTWTSPLYFWARIGRDQWLDFRKENQVQKPP